MKFTDPASGQTTNGTQHRFAYTYNGADGLETVRYPSSREVTTCYDSGGQAMTVSGVKVGVLKRYVDVTAYSAHGAPTSMRLDHVSPSGGPPQPEEWKILRAINYNSRLQMYSIGLLGATHTIELGYGPNMENNGNIRQQKITTTVPGATPYTQDYEYDALNRLQKVKESDQRQREFRCDEVGNCYVSNLGYAMGGSITPMSEYAFNNKNRIAGVPGTYDNAGNVLSMGGLAMTYDAENRLKTVLNGGTTHTYSYDGDGRRVMKWKSVSGQPEAWPTVYVYDAFGQLAAEHAPGAYDITQCTTCFRHEDHLGNTRMVTESVGTTLVVKALRDYMPYGEEMRDGRRSGMYTGGMGNTMAFTGKERSAETETSAVATGLDYFGARYYAGALGRFTSPDSTAFSKMSYPQSWNLYAYGLNNPLRFVDPTGNEVQAANCSTPTECQATLSAVQGALGSQQAASRVGLQKIQRGFWGRIGAAITGAPQYRFTIGGDMASFKALGQNASRFGQLVENRAVVTAAVSGTYKSYQGAQRRTPGGMGTVPSQGLDPAATVANNPTPFDNDTAGIIGGAFGAIPGANVNETMAHELLGHVWGEVVANHTSGSFSNLRDSVQAENAVRQTDPARGLKLQHHGDPNPTRVYSPQEIQRMRTTGRIP
jgi:RHS repeat-associated protein